MGFINHELERERQRERLIQEWNTEMRRYELNRKREVAKRLKEIEDDKAENIYKSLIKQERKGGVVIRSNKKKYEVK